MKLFRYSGFPQPWRNGDTPFASTANIDSSLDRAEGRHRHREDNPIAKTVGFTNVSKLYLNRQNYCAINEYGLDRIDRQSGTRC